MMKLIYCIAAWMVFLQFSCASANILSDPVVRVEQGLLRGGFMNNLHGEIFYAFKGIPFAKPPVGNLRFKAPQPPDPWSGIYNAMIESAKCPQLSTGITYVGDENCLTLNVFCHSLASVNKSLPVLVVIHGGGYVMGSAALDDMHPARLMSYDKIVIVAIQYRLSSLGFLSTGDSSTTGNCGLLDQVAALKWVQKNIRKFGGDPRKVTLLGYSAGAISIGMHLVSPLTLGLFHGAYLISGSPLMELSIQKDPLRIAKLFGNQLNCQSNDTSILVNCLRGKTAKELIETMLFTAIASGQVFPFAPAVEDPASGSYLLDSPEKLFQQGQFQKVPTVIGATKDEMASAVLFYPTLQAIKNQPMLTEDTIDHAFRVLIPDILRLILKYETNLVNLSLAVRCEYGDEYNFKVTKEFFRFLIDMATDASFRAGADKLTRLLVKKNVATFLYSFDYHGDLSQISSFGEKEVDHSQSTDYLLFPVLSERDGRMSDIMVTQLIGFMKHLNPNQKKSTIPKWTPTRDSRDLWYLQYADDRISMKEGYYTDKMAFWNNIAPNIASGKIQRYCAKYGKLDE